jgi:hypothetical protein
VSTLTFQEQLMAVPVQRVTTVIRVNLLLNDFDQAVSQLIAWANVKASPYDTQITSEEANHSFTRDRFLLDYSRSDGMIALHLEESDNSEADRIWSCDFSLERSKQAITFSTRLNYRQSQTVNRLPAPRAPRLLSDIVSKAKASDVWPLSTSAQTISPVDIPFVEELIGSPVRTLPVVVISDDLQRGPIVDVATVARLLAGTAHVLHLTPDSSWLLTRDWGVDWSCFGGGVRCYNAGIDRQTDEKFRHRLWMPASIERMEAKSRHSFANECATHVFRQLTARFEPFQLFTPDTLRRKAIETSQRPELSSAQIVKETAGVAEPAFNVESTLATDVNLTLNGSNLQELMLRVELAETRLRETTSALERSEQALSEARSAQSLAEVKRDEAEEIAKLSLEDNQSLTQERDSLLSDGETEPSEALKPLWAAFGSFNRASQNIAIQFRQMERDSLRADQLQNEVDETRGENARLQARLESTELRKLPASIESDGRLGRLVQVLPELASKNPPLTASLLAVGAAWNDRIEILPDAMASAKSSADFRLGEQAFDLLWKLATDYWVTVQEGGDVKARAVFGSTYAAREKKFLTKSGTAKRTFDVKGEAVFMEQHLRIGTADNTADTLRIHFCWLPKSKKIVIGHCGRHLDF